MGSFFSGNVAVFTFLPMLRIGILVDVGMLYRRRLHIHIRMSARTGMGGVSACQAGRIRYDRGILVGMVVGELGDGFFLCEAAEVAGEFHHTRSFLCCLFRNHARIEGMELRIQPDIAFVAAQRPVFIRIVPNLTGFSCAVTALAAVVVFPFCAFGANFMFASHIRCYLCTALLAQIAVGTDVHTVFTFDALLAGICAVRAILTAVDADVFHTVAAIITVTTHNIGTIDADAAIRTELVDAAGTLATILAYIFRTVDTNDTAVLTDPHTVAALIAVLTENIVRAFTADIAGGTEFVHTVGTLFFTIRTEVRAVFTAFAAGTYHCTV